MKLPSVFGQRKKDASFVEASAKTLQATSWNLWVSVNPRSYRPAFCVKKKAAEWRLGTRLHEIIIFCSHFLTVAYPEQVNVPTSYTVEVGDPVTLQCPYRPGALIQHYEYIWRVGLSAVLITDTDPRYSIGGDLIINPTALSDESLYYQCNVEVNNPNGVDFTQRSGFISLDIFGMCTLFQLQHRQ